MRKFLEKINNKILTQITNFRINDKIQKIPYEIKYFGNDPYGSWYFALTPGLEESTIILCGAGEDISFDIEFTSKFNSFTYIVDPTPRAISHVKSTLKRCGKNKKTQYKLGGKQDIEAYDMRYIKPNQVQLVENALWNQNETLKFYCPKDPKTISHSILNWQNSYSQDM